MKEVSQMTAHELAGVLLDLADKHDYSSPTAQAMREAAERLELGADGKGVGPTALSEPIRLAYVEARKRIADAELQDAIDSDQRDAEQMSDTPASKAGWDYLNGSNENPYEADTAEWREYEQSFHTCCIEDQKQADAQPF